MRRHNRWRHKRHHGIADGNGIKCPQDPCFRHAIHRRADDFDHAEYFDEAAHHDLCGGMEDRDRGTVECDSVTHAHRRRQFQIEDVPVGEERFRVTRADDRPADLFPV